jgi:hypothetical protein
LVLDENLKVGDYVQAGQRLGVISRYAAAFDLGVMNRNILQPFVNPKRYGYTQLYGDSPLKYFVEPYRSQLYAKVLREGEDKDGKFCYDQRGKLIGTWVEENAPPDSFQDSELGRLSALLRLRRLSTHPDQDFPRGRFSRPSGGALSPASRGPLLCSGWGYTPRKRHALLGEGNLLPLW